MLTMDVTEVWSRTSTGIAMAWPPVVLISWATVDIVEREEFGSGGKDLRADGSDVLFAAIATVRKA